jgi:integrase
LSFDQTVAPFVKATWEYRSRNPVAADLILLTLLWGMRRGESATFQWRDRISESEASVARWIDLKARVCYVYDPKNRSDHEFPIAPCALALLKLRRADQSEDEQWVFPTGSAQSTKPYLSDPSVAMKTIKEKAGIQVVRGHDLRRTFGAACEKLGFSDRAAKRMLGHSVSGGDSSGRYLSPEWADTMQGMERVEELILSKAPAVFNALRPRRAAPLIDADDVFIASRAVRGSRRKVR